MELKHFGFIGLGLIGGSIAKALRREYPDCYILAFDPNEDTRKNCVSELVVSKSTDTINSDFTDCDCIFLCAPVTNNNENLKQLKSVIREDTILTDVGSVKSPIYKAICEANLEANFVGGHPMAGSERIGYANSNPTILENAYYVLAPSSKSSDDMLQALKSLVSSIGAIPIVLSTDLHDYVTGAISHLPHVISAALVNLVHDEDTPDQIMKLIAAGGFKDITRISSSSPTMWQQICLTNSEDVTVLLDKYIESLKSIREDIANLNSDKLYNLFDSAREYRESFISASSGPIKVEYVLTVDIADKPGAIAAIASLLSMHSINIKNIGINHNREFAEGALRIEFYSGDATSNAVLVLNEHGYHTHSKVN